MKTGRPGCPGEKGLLTKGVEIVHNGGGIVLKAVSYTHLDVYKRQTRNNLESFVRGAAVAAIYAALTLALAPISYGAVQVRVSEALTVLPFFMPRSAVPGLFLGCFLANFLGGAGIWDVVFGSAATLIAAMLTARCRSRMLSPLAPVLVNAVVVGCLLYTSRCV